MAIKVKQLTNCNLYMEGGAFLGALASITLPEIKHKTIEHKGGDLIGTPKLPGAFESMTATLKMNGLYEDFHALAANPDAFRSIMVRANQKVRDGYGKTGDESVIVYLRGWFSASKIGEMKSSEGSNPEYTMEVSYYRLVVGGVDIEEIDVENTVHNVLGIDVLADFRSNLGIS